MPAQKSAQAQLGKVSGPGHADFGVGGDQVLLRRSNIGTTLEQGRRQAGGNLGRQILRGEASSARNFTGGFAQQQPDLIFGLFDLLLDHGDGLRRGVHQLLGLAQVEQRRDAA